MGYARVIEDLSTEAELDAADARDEALAALLASFVAGARFITIRIAIHNRLTRLQKDTSFDASTVFDAQRLVDDVKGQCLSHEVASGVLEEARCVAADAAIEYPPEIGTALGVAGFGLSRSRLEQRLRGEGVSDAHIERFRELYDIISQANKVTIEGVAVALVAPAPSASRPPVQALPFTTTEDGIELDEPEGNAFHLSVILRKYTSAKLSFIGGRRRTVVEDKLLWDALGLLRSLSYDVKQFNTAADGGGRTRSETRYLCYRLMRQASSFGVRLPKAAEGVVAVDGLDELIAHIETHPKHKEHMEVARATVRSGLVDFASLAELFAPGADLVEHGAATGLFGVPMGVRVRACYYSRGKSLFGVVSTFYAACEFAVSVGDRFAVIEAHQAIPEFQGTRSTRTLQRDKNPTFTLRASLIDQRSTLSCE